MGGAGAVCALAAFANLDTVCAALGYCAGELVDDVQAWFAPTWKGYLETALTIKADYEPGWASIPDWGSATTTRPWLVMCTPGARSARPVTPARTSRWSRRRRC